MLTVNEAYGAANAHSKATGHQCQVVEYKTRLNQGGWMCLQCDEGDRKRNFKVTWPS